MARATSKEDLAILRKVPIFELSSIPEPARQSWGHSCARLFSGTCSTLHLPAGNKEPVKILSALHCTVVKIHETSFRGCQIRRLSIAKTPIQEVFLRRSATRFLITRCPALPLLQLHNCARHPSPRNNHSGNTFRP